MFLFFFLNIFFRNLIFWWSIFVLITIVFLFITKIKLSFSRGVNYFIFQEFLGLLFIIFIGIILQFFVLILKVGMSPFHFWVYSVISSLDGNILIWFLTFQKLPFLPIFVIFFNLLFFFILFFGVVFCYLQVYSLKNFKYIFFVSSTESFNWLVLGLLVGVWGFFLFFFYYFFRIIFLISEISFFGLNLISLETVFVFINIPLTVSFFLKIFLLYTSLFIYDFFLLFILILIFLSSLSFLYWLLFFSVKKFNLYKDYYLNLFFIPFILFFFVVFYHFSKINYITLIEWSSLRNDRT